MIIAGIVVIIAVIVGSMVFAPNGDSKFTTIDVLNKGAVGENATLYIKLSDNDKTALSGKTIHVKITNNKNKVIYDDSVKTHATGVAIANLTNVSAGNYDLNVTYDGDGNYTGSSISQKLTVKSGHVEEQVENSTLIAETIADAQSPSDSSSSSSSQSYTPSSQSSQSDSSSSRDDSSQSSSSSSDNSPETVIDENGKEVLPQYDENGKEVIG